MKFKRYNSIENTYRTKTLNTIAEQGKSGGEWIVEEKVHGANFSFWFDGEKMRTAKRSGFVGNDGENFFNSDLIKERYETSVKHLYNQLKLSHEFDTLVVFGEIFGGNYPHEDIENDNGIGAVQNGIWYSPNIEFYAYDIKLIVGDDVDDWKKNYFLNTDVCNKLFTKFGIFHAKTLFKGTLSECLEYENLYITRIPEWLGLPEIENNTCEGNILKPVEASYFWNGSRVALKNKNEKFSEKKNKAPKVRVPIELTESATELLEEALCHVTENRLRNVLSKIGEVKQRDFGKVMGHMNADVFEDFLKDSKEDFADLDAKERKFITKKVGQENADMLRTNFLNIIDGVY